MEEEEQLCLTSAIGVQMDLTSNLAEQELAVVSKPSFSLELVSDIKLEEVTY